MPVHTQDVVHLDLVAGTLRLGKNVGLLTDTNVAASNTIDALKTAVTTAANAGHAQNAQIAINVNNAIEWMRAAGYNSDAIQAPLVGVDALIALVAQTATKTSVHKRHE